MMVTQTLVKCLHCGSSEVELDGDTEHLICANCGHKFCWEDVS